jgi:hypothetical protein
MKLWPNRWFDAIDKAVQVVNAIMTFACLHVAMPLTRILVYISITHQIIAPALLVVEYNI